MVDEKRPSTPGREAEKREPPVESEARVKGWSGRRDAVASGQEEAQKEEKVARGPTQGSRVDGRK